MSGIPDNKRASGRLALYGKSMFGEALRPQRRGKLAEDFLISPMTVINARDGWWQDRKRAWLALGIQSEIGRSARAYNDHEWIAAQNGKAQVGGGTSIFDPVLCEALYRWFCPDEGLVLDPFAGGSVRGIVAGLLRRQYVGIELRPEQVAANVQQALDICNPDLDCIPRWVNGDARMVGPLCPRVAADFLFSCPPYGDLEVYSDNPADLSAMDPQLFLQAYRDAIRESCALLKNNRFACFVVGDYRCRDGFYNNFVAQTVDAFLDAGLHLYNEAILVTAVGSLAMRTIHQFNRSRKMGRTHQNILVFVKGDPVAATDAIGPVIPEAADDPDYI